MRSRAREASRSLDCTARSMPGKVGKRSLPDWLAFRVTPDRDRLHVVVQHFRRHPAEVSEGCVVLAL